jgi:hypothetical protein
MNKTHRASLILSLIAFLLFVANEWYVLAGYGELPLSGPVGATILTGFFAAGLIVQALKFAEGHKSKIDLSITLIMLPAHAAAGLTIWIRTKIMHLGLPAELPYYIVGLYWVIGLIEVVARYIGRELKLFKSTYVSPEQELIDLKREYAILETQMGMRDRQREDRREQRQVSRPAQLPASTAGVNSVQRRERVYSLLAQNPSLGVTDIQRQIGVKSRGTVYNDLNDLIAEGRAAKDGDKFKALTPSNGNHAP